MIGFVCVVINTHTGSARFKSDFVLKEWRSQGIYQQLFRYRLRYTLRQNVQLITAFCTPMSVKTYLRHGFRYARKVG